MWCRSRARASAPLRGRAARVAEDRKKDLELLQKERPGYIPVIAERAADSYLPHLVRSLCSRALTHPALYVCLSLQAQLPPFVLFDTC